MVTMLLAGALFTTGCGEEDPEEAPNFSLAGSWELPGGFDNGHPNFITFFDNGEYAVYADCAQQGDDGGIELEIGTYTANATTLTITGHIQNGCGGFDSDEDASVIPPDPINILFSNDGSAVTLNESLTLSRVRSATSPIVGAWNLPSGFDASNPHLVTFFANGEYVVYTDCSLQDDPRPDLDLEIGTYTATETSLTIASHVENGCGGFDADDDALSRPTEPLAISFNSDKSSFTLVDKGVTSSRVE